MRLMLRRKMFHVKLANGVELQASQYAFTPKTVVSQPVKRKSSEAPKPEAIMAPFEAFRPWEKPKPDSDVAAEQEYADPTDPNAPIDDEALFATDLPMEQ